MGRNLVIETITKKMIDAFTEGNAIDAANLEAFLRTLEGISDTEYEDLVAEEQTGALS